MSSPAQLLEQGTVKLIRRDFIGALGTFEECLLADPKNAMAWNNRGLCLLNLGQNFDAILNLDKAIKFAPKAVEFLNNRGVASFNLSRYQDAVDFYAKSLALHSDHPEANLNMGNVQKLLGDLTSAIHFFRQSVKAKPEYVNAHLHLGFSLLQAGQYPEGWKEFEWRWKSDQLTPRGLPIPPWDGEDLNGKKILVYSEQGFGDALQFVRFAPEIKKKYPKATVTIEIRQPLARLMKTVKGIDGVYVFGEKLPEDIDYVSPMMSLPRVLGTTVETIPVQHHWFDSDPTRRAMWEEMLCKLPPGLRVGICWAGMSRPDNLAADDVDKRRSTTLQSFAPAAAVPGVSWTALQKGPPTAQVKVPPAGMTILNCLEDEDDFYDTAALIGCLDLVIAVDTAVVHVAASLGVPTWVLSRFDGCWRWLGHRKDCPWYPSVTQFVQHKPNDWTGVQEEVGAALRKFVDEHAAGVSTTIDGIKATDYAVTA